VDNSRLLPLMICLMRIFWAAVLRTFLGTPRLVIAITVQNHALKRFFGADISGEK
jgi:hypothetical protein